MLLSYRDPDFWKKFTTEHWRPRVPTVLRQPFKNYPFSEASLLRAMQAFENGLREGDRRAQCLVSIGDAEKPPRRPLRDLFREESETMAALERRCKRVFHKQRFGLMVTRFEAIHPEIWSSLTAFLHDARHCIDYPVPRAFVDLFYGNYRSSFTGVHKDTQEIFAFVVRGKKRMLAWPFDYFLSRVAGLSRGDRYFHMRLPVDPRKYRKDAIVLEAEPGDVFYWPSDYWHVADNPDGGFSAMVSLGLYRPEIAVPKARFTEKLLSGKSLRSQGMTDVVRGPDAARQLRWITGFGFELGGPLTEKAPSAASVIKTESGLLLWTRDRDRDRIIVAANGQSVALPDSSRLLGALETIAAEKPFSAGTRPGKPVKVAETTWNKKCALKTRTKTTRDPQASLIDWLLRTHAVVPYSKGM